MELITSRLCLPYKEEFEPFDSLTQSTEIILQTWLEYIWMSFSKVIAPAIPKEKITQLFGNLKR